MTIIPVMLEVLIPDHMEREKVLPLVREINELLGDRGKLSQMTFRDEQGNLLRWWPS